MKESLQISHLNKSFQVNGESIQVLDDINLDIKKGEFISIIGHGNLTDMLFREESVSF